MGYLCTWTLWERSHHQPTFQTPNADLRTPTGGEPLPMGPHRRIMDLTRRKPWVATLACRGSKELHSLDLGT